MGMGGKSGGKAEITEYAIGLHMGICSYTDGLSLIAVKYADKEIWRGNLIDQDVVGINKPDLFGDVKKEGGVKGLLWWLPGKSTQVMPESLARRLGLTSATCPGFRGFASIFLTGVADVTEAALAPVVASITNTKLNAVFQLLTGQPSAFKRGFYLAANNPYLRDFKMRARRAPVGLNPSIAMIRIDDDSNGNQQFAANPVHIIYECLTNKDWGMGEGESVIDKVAYEAAAQTVYDEQLGMSMLWTRQSEIGKFISEVSNHIQAALYVNPTTGKHTIKLLRGGYNIEELPSINPSNAIIEDFARKAWGELGNEIVVTMTIAETGKTKTVTVQDLAGIAAEGCVISSSRNYYGFVSEKAATYAAERDLAASVNPIATCRATVSREFWSTVSSDVVVLSWPEYDIERIVFRVSEVTQSNNTMTLELYEDIFGLDTASYLGSGSDEWVNPSLPPTPATYYQLGTAPAFMAAQALDLTDPSELEYPTALSSVTIGADSDDDTAYELYTYLTDVNGVTTRASIGSRAYFGTFAFTRVIPAETQTLLSSLPGLRGGVPEAGDFILISMDNDENTEICTVQSYDEAGYLLNRGMLDTIPRAWPIGTRCFIIPADSLIADQTSRAVYENASYWILTKTSVGTLALDDAPKLTVTLSPRPFRPNRPANVKINGVGFGVVAAASASNLVVTWANRNRILESTQAMKWTDANVDGEAGQTTTIEVRAGGNLILTRAGLTGTTHTISKADIGTSSPVVVTVASVANGYRSLQSYSLTVTF